MIEPLRLSLEVACGIEHAYDTWLAAWWWPASHTMTGRKDVDVVFEAKPQGRIFERSPEGEDVDFGEVLECVRPTLVRYVWHMRAPREDATEVLITFEALGEDRTRVDIEHRGWERLGDRGQAWRDRNAAGWNGLLPHYRAALEGG